MRDGGGVTSSRRPCELRVPWGPAASGKRRILHALLRRAGGAAARAVAQGLCARLRVRVRQWGCDEVRLCSAAGLRERGARARAAAAREGEEAEEKETERRQWRRRRGAGLLLLNKLLQQGEVEEHEHRRHDARRLLAGWLACAAAAAAAVTASVLGLAEDWIAF